MNNFISVRVSNLLLCECTSPYFSKAIVRLHGREIDDEIQEYKMDITKKTPIPWKGSKRFISNMLLYVALEKNPFNGNRLVPPFL